MIVLTSFTTGEVDIVVISARIREVVTFFLENSNYQQLNGHIGVNWILMTLALLCLCGWSLLSLKL
jgi:hypothetical protein